MDDCTRGHAKMYACTKVSLAVGAIVTEKLT